MNAIDDFMEGQQYFQGGALFTTIIISNITCNSTGTGFFIQKVFSGTELVRILLFTNKHVVWGSDYKKSNLSEVELNLKFHKKTDNLGDFHNINVKINKNSNIYFEHENIDIDVCCIDISYINNSLSDVYIASTNSNDLNVDYNKVLCGANITFIGYPTGYYDTKHYLPIYRTGTISSNPRLDFQGEKKILIDAQVFPGSSGSPVFTSINGKFHLIGILSHSHRKLLDVLAVENPSNNLKLLEYTGLGLLFKVDVINEVLDKVPFEY